MKLKMKLKMNPNKPKFSSLLSLAILASGLFLTGCSQLDTAAEKAAPTTKAAPETPKSAKAAGGVPDMNTYPAPPGAKTGLEGGKKD